MILSMNWTDYNSSVQIVSHFVFIAEVVITK